MKKWRILGGMLIGVLLFVFAACDANPNGWAPGDSAGFSDDLSSNYGIVGEMTEDPFRDPETFSQSTFSLDGNTAMYSVMRSRLNGGWKVDPEDVRIEEYLNYFRYDDPAPEEGEPVALNASLYGCPWNEEHLLLRLRVRTEDIQRSETDNNLVFLIDASGSMAGENRIGLVKYGFGLLLQQLNPTDKVSIVTYANGTQVLERGVAASERVRLVNTINNIRANGGTGGQDGLKVAYDVLHDTWIRGANNRVILISDGDFNIGYSSPEELREFIREQSDGGAYLSVFGVGMGNYRDDILKTLAENGQGSYGYIDSQREAERVFCESVNSSIRTVAKDAKSLVEFHPEAVQEYRILGYETKRITIEDFDDPEKDTGEIGSGLSVTAMYEIVPTASFSAGEGGSIGTFTVRYKDVGDAETPGEKSLVLPSGATEPTEDDVFAACVAEFGLVLRDSKYADGASLGAVKERLGGLRNEAEDRQEFRELVNLAISLYGEAPLGTVGIL